ncbi:GSCFA domain-containing protein [Chitinophaga sp. Cy-1792]|uniref:GSCFA domain-containing protein n=1 Tax=Chitinophaga sp. Cy-1792 TaxID=2608339 RepID=UPI001422F9BD|nr:GSCFA domain-containing protein [Chitinophaga sp. Cy-1792]NIG54856.1 GSCFA domain-containing protein [Chitinophaga sp. Cy-1792]
MQFHLSFPITPLEEAIQYSDKLLLMGSCFAEEIGGELQSHRFNTMINPHGILFNPLSITHALTSYLDGKVYTKNDLFLHNDLWHSWDHHSRFSDTSADVVLERINRHQQEAAAYLEQADWLVITLGSAHAHFLKENNKLVANNHKVPAGHFYKKLIGAEEIITALDNVMHRLFFRNKKVKLLFTVSPVRYIRDGVVENNLSKAVLLQAVHHLVNKFDRLYYFPAYELVIDDLRDYRFYKEDMVHPNGQAIAYVWDKVVENCIHPASQEILHTIADISRAAAHRPFNPATPQHQQFVKTYIGKINQLQATNADLQLESLLTAFQQQLL